MLRGQAPQLLDVVWVERGRFQDQQVGALSEAGLGERLRGRGAGPMHDMVGGLCNQS